MRIAFVTSAQVGGITGDDDLTAALLRARGHQVVPAIWDDGGVSWGAFDAVIIRSPWDYYFRPAAFAGWLRQRQRDGSRVLNPPAAVLENIDKRYLLRLAARGVAIVPTVPLQRGSDAALPAILCERSWDEVVVTPAISAGA